MTPDELQLASSLLTILFTAITTATVTAKANERVLKNALERLDDLEGRIFDHEKRISRLEGSVRT